MANELAKIIYDAIQDTSFEYYGIRVDDGVDYADGDKTEDSRRWHDGLPTDEILDGTSSIGIDFNESIEEIEKKLDMTKEYFGDRMYLIAGNSVEYGTDQGEYLIQDATVVKVLM